MRGPGRIPSPRPCQPGGGRKSTSCAVDSRTTSSRSDRLCSGRGLELGDVSFTPLAPGEQPVRLSARHAEGIADFGRGGEAPRVQFLAMAIRKRIAITRSSRRAFCSAAESLGFGDGDDGWSEGGLMPCQAVAAVVASFPKKSWTAPPPRNAAGRCLLRQEPFARGAYATCACPSTWRCGCGPRSTLLPALPTSIRRGRIASGISRLSSIVSRPSARSAPATFT